MTMSIPTAGEADEIEPGLRRILAPNPSRMTHWGTNTYLLGAGSDLCVVDPGPDDADHLDAILRAAGGARITQVLVTHSHRDHSALASRLAARTGASLAAFGPPDAGRSPVMQALAAGGLTGGGEGVDATFRPDRTLSDGEVIAGAGWQVEAIHTPGHMGNHLCLALGDLILTGDHVMGWASSLVSPPDGDVSDFMISCARLALRQARRLYPGHGAAVEEPLARLDWLIAHRRAREAQVLDALSAAAGPLTARDLVQRIYTDLPPELEPAAERNVLAHLIDLAEKGMLATPGRPHETSAFTPA